VLKRLLQFFFPIERELGRAECWRRAAGDRLAVAVAIGLGFEEGDVAAEEAEPAGQPDVAVSSVPLGLVLLAHDVVDAGGVGDEPGAVLGSGDIG